MATTKELKFCSGHLATTYNCPTLQAVEALLCRHWIALKQSLSTFVRKAKRF